MGIAVRKVGAWVGDGDPLTKADVGLPNVDNTSDLNKPVSTAQQNALDLKLDIAAIKAAATTNVRSSKVTGDSVNRFQIDAAGKMEWSSGGAAIDINLYKGGSGELKTDGSLIASASGAGAKIGATGPSSKAGILFALGGDTGMYRDANGTMRFGITSADHAVIGATFQATGKTGANTTPTTLVGGNTTGAPSSGAHVKGEFAPDDAANLYYCTAAGTPGTWLPVTNSHATDASAHPLQTNSQTGTTYTLVLADAGKVVEANNASAQTYTVPPNSSVAFGIGTVIEIYQLGAGAITVAAGAGVTLRAPGGLVSGGQYTSMVLRKRATDEWAVEGTTSSAWASYTPTITQSGTVTTSSTTARYTQIGKTVMVSGIAAVSGTGTTNNQITISLPVTASASAALTQMGTGYFYDTSANAQYTGVALPASTTAFRLFSQQSGGSPIGQLPNIALGSGDELRWSLTYEAA